MATFFFRIKADYDPVVVEQKEQAQPSCIPMSYVLRFFTDAERQENNGEASKQSPDPEPGMKCSNSSSSIGSSLRSSTPTGSDMEDEDKSDTEDSNDSWTTPEEFSADFILSLAMKSRNPLFSKKHSPGGWVGNIKDSNSSDKPFACPVPGCKKRYKNVNGIKYHSKNGHKKEGKVRKGFKCHCGKSYKTAHGLRMHTTANHNGSNLTTVTTSTGEILQIPATQVTTLQPLRTLTVKQLPAGSVTSLSLPVKSIQSVVVTTKQGNELINKNNDLDTNKPPSVRIWKDLTLPLVKNTIWECSTSAFQSFLNNTSLTDNDIRPSQSVDGFGGFGILDEIERLSDLVSHEPLNDDFPLVNLEDINPSVNSDNNNLFQIKLEPEKDNLIKLMPNDDSDKIQVGPVQMQSPDSKIKLTNIKPASIKLSSPQLVANLASRLSPNLESINKNSRPQAQEGGLDILTPSTSPLTSPDKSNPLLVKSHSPILPLTPISPAQNSRICLQSSVHIPELNESEKMDEPNLFFEDMESHPDL